jgi:hypothetical protein
LNTNRDDGQKPASFGAYLFAELRQAFQDMRQKVVEEGWFGRVVTAAPVVEVERQGRDAAALYGDDHGPLKPREQGPSFEEQWAPCARDEMPSDFSQEHGIDIGR